MNRQLVAAIEAHADGFHPVRLPRAPLQPIFSASGAFINTPDAGHCQPPGCSRAVLSGSASCLSQPGYSRLRGAGRSQPAVCKLAANSDEHRPHPPADPSAQLSISRSTILELFGFSACGGKGTLVGGMGGMSIDLATREAAGPP